MHLPCRAAGAVQVTQRQMAAYQWFRRHRGVAKHIKGELGSMLAHVLGDETRLEQHEGIGDDEQREFSRVHNDIRMGRIKDALWCLERVLDDVAPSWRELA